MKKFNHAMTVAFVVHSDHPTDPTFDEWMDALRNRLKELEADPVEAVEAWASDAPFDTIENE